jgi:hypothetical protein
VVVAEAVNMRELRRYVERVSDRWPLAQALLGGARVDDARGAGEQRERGAEYVMVLVSEGFDGMPWLERVYQAGSLWDANEMGDAADVHCYTPSEYERKRSSLAVVRRTADSGIDALDELVRGRVAWAGGIVDARRRGQEGDSGGATDRS